jgi:two-component system sensor histidine kinase RegB
MRERAARNERLASVTTLAAGAAHELGTPLATIAVATKELERTIQTLPAAQAQLLTEDAALIRSQLERCRAILDRLAADFGQMPGEAPVELRVQDLVQAIVEALPGSYRARLEVTTAGDGAAVSLPRAALLQIAQNLLRNAFEAGGGLVALSVEGRASGLRVLVQDEGMGMAPEVLARAGEPFFSTKPPGEGLGLGLFIARTLTEQMGGRLALDARPGHGTTASVEIPGSVVRARQSDGR